jgi:TonB family protein
MLLCALVGVVGRSSAQNLVKEPEQSLRARAIASPKPAYPRDLVKRGVEGPAVASVIVGEDGTVEAVVVIQSPDPLIASEMQQALKAWTFRPLRIGMGPSGQPARVASKLTLYFRVKDNIGIVLNPAELSAAANGPVGIPIGQASGASSPRGIEAPSQPAVAQIDEASLAATLQKAGVRLLDVRDRDAFRLGHRDGALNIPGDELAVRVPIELADAKTIVIDCVNAGDIACRYATAILQRQSGVTVQTLGKAR